MFSSLRGLFLAVQMETCAPRPFTYLCVFSSNICLGNGCFGCVHGHACFKAVKLGVNVLNSWINSKGNVFLDGPGSVWVNHLILNCYKRLSTFKLALCCCGNCMHCVNLGGNMCFLLNLCTSGWPVQSFWVLLRASGCFFQEL